jgi:stringent starvation protein B
VSEQAAKPYLVRALYEWCSDQGYTPYLVVKVGEKTKVPMAYVRDGQITLNVSATATQQLTMDNEWVLFNARFNGASQEVAVPMSNVIGLYARETGYGMGFTIPEVAPVGEQAMQLEIDSSPAATPTDAATTPEDEPPKPQKSRAHLSVVK